MTQEDKDLLLKDLCARLPYGLKLHYKTAGWEDKNTSKVNKVVLRCMLDEFKQYFGL